VHGECVGKNTQKNDVDEEKHSRTGGWLPTWAQVVSPYYCILAASFCLLPTWIPGARTSSHLSLLLSANFLAPIFPPFLNRNPCLRASPQADRKKGWKGGRGASVLLSLVFLISHSNFDFLSPGGNIQLYHPTESVTPPADPASSALPFFFFISGSCPPPPMPSAEGPDEVACFHVLFPSSHFPSTPLL